MIAHCTLELGIKSFSLLSKTVKHITKGDYRQIINGRVKVGWWLIAKIISQERNREAFYLDMEREKKMRKWDKPFRFDQHVGWNLVPLMLLHPGVYLRPKRINLFWNNCVPDLNLYSIIMINHGHRLYDHYHLSWPVFSPTSKWSLFPSSPFAHLMVEIVIMGILFHTPKLFYHLRTNCKSDPIATDSEHLRIHLMWDGASLMVRIWIWEISSLFFLCWIWIWNIWLFLFLWSHQILFAPSGAPVVIMV